MSWLGYETVYCPLIFLMKKKKNERERDKEYYYFEKGERASETRVTKTLKNKQTNKLKQINKKTQFFHEGYRVRV